MSRFDDISPTSTFADIRFGVRGWVNDRINTAITWWFRKQAEAVEKGLQDEPISRRSR